MRRCGFPEHVVHRAFPGETVVLNLETGRYHGLNPTGARMLAVLERSDSVATALEELSAEYDVPRAELEQDLRDLCEGLLSRDLIELASGRP